jgi:hypothetical protein
MTRGKDDGQYIIMLAERVGKGKEERTQLNLKLVGGFV